MRTSAVVTAAVLAVVLAGCSEDKQATPLPPIPSATASAAPTLTPPPEALAETPQGASAFARYFVSVIEGAINTGDATQLKALSDPGCSACRNFIGAAEAGDGQTVRGAPFVVEFAEAPPVQGGEVIVEVRYRREAGELLDAQGKVVQAIAPEGPVDVQLRLVRQQQSWKVFGMRSVKR